MTNIEQAREQIKKYLQKYKAWILNNSWQVAYGRFTQDDCADAIQALLQPLIDQAKAEGERKILEGLLDILEINKNDPLAVPVKMKNILEGLLKENEQALQKG